MHAPYEDAFNDCANIFTVSSSVRFLIADRASRVIVKASALRATSVPAVGRVLYACFNDCANICTVSSSHDC